MSESKIRVLHAALQLFATKGYASTSMSNIANAVGIQKSTLYSHFKNKETLFETIFEHIIEQNENTVEQLLQSIKNETPLEQLEHYFINYIQYCRNNIEVDFWIRFYYFPPQSLESSILSQTNKAESRNQKKLLSIIEKGIQTKEIRDIPAEDVLLNFYQLLMGFLMSLNDYKIKDPESDMQRCLKLFFAGIRT